MFSGIVKISLIAIHCIHSLHCSVFIRFIYSIFKEIFLNYKVNNFYIVFVNEKHGINHHSNIMCDSVPSTANRFNLRWTATQLILLKIPTDAAQISFGTCTPQQSDERGQCVHIASCPYLANILKASPQTAAQRELLSKSQCGLDNRRQQTDLMNRILVCCPQSKRGDSSAVPETPDPDGQQPGNVLPGTDTCGFLFGDRIVGGTNTTLWEFPWMVLLRYKKRE